MRFGGHFFRVQQAEEAYTEATLGTHTEREEGRQYRSKKPQPLPCRARGRRGGVREVGRQAGSRPPARAARPAPDEAEGGRSGVGG
jgi:hypothetical protein